jgi:hypothetical protein
MKLTLLSSLPLYTPPPAIKSLPLEWLLARTGEPSFTDRILACLIQAEAHENDPWLRDDIRQSFITLSLAENGDPQPFVSASYRMYGLHPDKLWPAIIARREALLGREYNSPKKPVQSVRVIEKRKKAA